MLPKIVSYLTKEKVNIGGITQMKEPELIKDFLNLKSPDYIIKKVKNYILLSLFFNVIFALFLSMKVSIVLELIIVCWGMLIIKNPKKRMNRYLIFIGTMNAVFVVNSILLTCVFLDFSIYGEIRDNLTTTLSTNLSLIDKKVLAYIIGYCIIAFSYFFYLYRRFIWKNKDETIDYEKVCLKSVVLFPVAGLVISNILIDKVQNFGALVFVICGLYSTTIIISSMHSLYKFYLFTIYKEYVN